MPLYTKRPVVIEAHDWRPDHTRSDLDLLQWIKAGGGKARVVGRALLIDTLEGEMMTLPGDYVIKGIKGEFYPCKPDIFAMTYEAFQC